jgi:hypothetical protein
VPTFLDSLQHKIDANAAAAGPPIPPQLPVQPLLPVFSFFLTRHPSAAGSVFTLGGYDLSLAGPNASWHYTPVVQMSWLYGLSYWTVTLSSFQVSGSTLHPVPCTL